MITEIKKDIFEWIEENRKDNVITLVHCISADWKMGLGIAKIIDEKFQVKERLRRIFEPCWTGHGFGLITPVLTVEEISPHLHICNLITKEHYWEKPTYITLSESLEFVKPLITWQNSFAEIDNLGMKIVMPKIGCGLDKLEWETVKTIIEEWSDNLDVTVCYL